MDDHDPSVDAVVDYCRTQARLLSGQAETLADEIDTLLAEIDAEVETLQERLDGRREGTASPEGTTDPGHPADAVAELEARQATVAELEARQATVAEKQAHLDDVRDLSAGYVDLAETLQTDDSDVTAAITDVLEFEADAGAPAFFDERETLLETATDQ